MIIKLQWHLSANAGPTYMEQNRTNKPSLLKKMASQTVYRIVVTILVIAHL